MKALYLDTTKNLTIGLLEGTCSWINIQKFDGLKSSESIHFNILKILNEADLKLTEIDRIFTAAGPGSYTGMRVSEGIAQIFSWQGIKTNSFYHFQVPQILGKENYLFICKAFKGEFFLKGPKEEKLLPLKDLSAVLDMAREKEIEVFSNFPDKDFLNLTYTSDLIEKNPSVIFSKVEKENMKFEPFYFRPLEKEFKVVDG